ncbi:hypothetical protein CEXT_275521 [Caerostris extrusa]|uniref:Uncharacterized protein n=1 Tax=Caerostris extrusa TaxID=172846 RepID=A0AAV4YAA2_CAEEX|nr:hypothetical protein CEXT_275521 [Caerostris extrusa]
MALCRFMIQWSPLLKILCQNVPCGSWLITGADAKFSGNRFFAGGALFKDDEGLGFDNTLREVKAFERIQLLF